MDSPCPPSPKIVLLAGEASGDLLGGELMAALRERFPDAQMAGVGSRAMRSQGLECWADSSELAVMGLAEVLAHLPRLLRLRRRLRRQIQSWQPDVFIGIDAPDFNLGLARSLKRSGIATLQYVSPSIWAWRQGRAAKIGRCVDRVLCLFPFEPDIYARYDVKASYVGHPLAQRYPLEPDRAAARAQLGLPEHGPVVALMPGSRRGEIERLSDCFAHAAALLQRRHKPTLVHAAADDWAAQRFAQSLEHHGVVGVRTVTGQSDQVLQAADAVLLASGTAALEALLAKTPMTVAYRLAPATHWFVRVSGLLKIPYYSLPNVLAGGRVVPELMQDEATAEALAQSMSRVLEDPDTRAAQRDTFQRIHQDLRTDAGRRATHAIAEMLGC